MAIETNVGNLESSGDGQPSTDTTLDLPLNAEGTAEINVANDRDWVSVTLAAGTEYLIRMRGTDTDDGSLADPFLVLRDSEGGFLVQDDDGGTGANSELTYTPSVTGTFYIEARAFGASNTGTYTVSVEEVGATPSNQNALEPMGDVSSDTSTSAALEINTTGTAQLNSSGDRDWISVNLLAGTEYTFEVKGSATDDGTLTDPFLVLRNSSGEFVAQDDDGGTEQNARLTFTPSESGTFYIEARSFGSPDTGTYTVTVSDGNEPESVGDLEPMGDASGSAATSMKLPVGSEGTGSMDFAGDRDWARTSLTAGVEYTIEMRGADSGDGDLADPFLVVRSSDGSFLAQDDNGGAGDNARLSFTPTTSGIHYIEARAFGSANTGTYTLSIVETNLAFPPEESTELSVGQTLAGTINPAGDHDYYQLTLTAGTAYVFDLEGAPTGAGTLADPILRLYDADGDLLDSDDDGGTGVNARLNFNPVESGTYYLRAEDLGNTDTGTYAITADLVGDEFPPENARNLGVGETTGDLISPVGDEDYFRLNLIQANVYTFELSGTDGNGNPMDGSLSLFDASGILLSSVSVTDTTAELEFTPSASGVYYLRVEDAGDDDTATYTITLLSNGLFPGEFPTPMQFGVTLSGLINPAGDKDYVSVDLTAGETYTFDLEGSSNGAATLPDPFLTIFASGGTELASDDNSGVGLNARLVFTPTTSGTYFLQIEGLGDDPTGAYRITGEVTSSSSSQAALLRGAEQPSEGQGYTLNGSDTEASIVTKFKLFEDSLM